MIDDKKDFRERLGKSLQIELKDGSWLTHVNQSVLRNEFNTETDHFVTSKEGGIDIFNRISKSFDVEPLRDPSGYMALDGNIQSHLKSSYREQYSTTLDNIDDFIVDGTGYGIDAVLNKVDSVIRKDMKNILPEGISYGDLRFIEAGTEQKQAIDNMVSARVSKTLAFEKKRSYEGSSLERIDKNFKEASDKLTEALSGETENILEM